MRCHWLHVVASRIGSWAPPPTAATADIVDCDGDGDANNLFFFLVGGGGILGGGNGFFNHCLPLEGLNPECTVARPR